MKPIDDTWTYVRVNRHGLLEDGLEEDPNIRNVAFVYITGLPVSSTCLLVEAIAI